MTTASPTDRVSVSQLASILGVSHEYARRLVVACGRAEKDSSGHWHVARSWAEKFARLRSVYRARERDDIDAPYRARLVLLVGEDGRAATISVAVDEIEKLEHVFGPLPQVYGAEEASVLRTVEALNTMRDGYGTLRTPWPDRWARLIGRRQLTVSIAPVAGAQHG